MNAPSGAAGRDTDLARLVEAERLALLYRLTPRTLVTAVLFSLLVAWVLKPVTGIGILAAWLAANNAVTVVRYLDIVAYRRNPPAIEQVPARLRRFVFLTLCAGTIWGLMGTLLLPRGDFAYQAIVTLFLAGTTTVGLFTLSSSWIAYAVLASPVLVPPAIYLFLLDEPGTLALSSSIALFWIVVLVNSRLMARNTLEMLGLRLQAARLAESREHALQAAEEAGRARLQFLANMSHEIRTPLNGILGMAELLQTTPLDAEQHRRLGAINASGQHLLALIGDILDFSKAEARKLDIAPQVFNARKLPAEVLDLLGPRAQEKGLQLACVVEPEVPQWLNGDIGRIKQVLHNLVGNAIKFTETGRVSVRMCRADPGGQAAGEAPVPIRLEVHDTGSGISPDDQTKLFEVFRQLDPTSTRRHGGAGLGLAISRQLVERMGGRIGCDSAPGRGSVFWFEIPLPPAATPACEPAAAVRDSSSIDARLLLVEDNPVNSEIASLMLRDLGIEVVAVEDGLAAVAAANEGGFDLILMDCQLPGIDGLEATRRIVAHERATGRRHTPIVALTANALRGDRESCLAAGMDDYLAKPFRMNELRSIVGRWLDRLPA
jgi:signal transduction histidine kinase